MSRIISGKAKIDENDRSMLVYADAQKLTKIGDMLQKSPGKSSTASAGLTLAHCHMCGRAHNNL